VSLGGRNAKRGKIGKFKRKTNQDADNNADSTPLAILLPVQDAVRLWSRPRGTGASLRQIITGPIAPMPAQWRQQ
jgi:hypothetical protein